MKNVLIQKTTQRMVPQQILLSTMVQATADELVSLINDEVEKNFVLEADDPREVSMDGYDSQNDSLNEGDGEPGGDTNDASNETEPAEEPMRQDSAKDEDAFFEYDDDSPSDRMGHRNADDDDYTPGANTESEQTFRDDLKQQIDMLEITEEERYLAHYIIDSLDDDGYMRRSLEELVDDLEFTQHHHTTEEDLEAVLVEIVQEELEPSGIGARDLRECLKLQLQERKATPATRLAFAIVDEAFDDLVQKRYDRLQEGFGIKSHQLLVDAMRVIRHLNPKPGNMQPVTAKQGAQKVMQVRPDFTVRNEDGTLVVTLNDGRLPQVRISEEQEQLLTSLQKKLQHPQESVNASAAKQDQQAVQLLKDNIEQGNTFIDALRQRRVTLIRVMETIVQMQRAFFLTGQVETLRPMVLQDVAERSGYDISTISRVSNSKFVDTDFGILSIKELFTTGLKVTRQAEGCDPASDSQETESVMSNVAIMEVLKELIESEDKHHPLTDEKLAQMMQEKGYPIARRTVVKYREKLGLPVARMRKEL